MARCGLPRSWLRISCAGCIISLIVLLSICVPEAWADGFRNPFHDAAAIGQGNASAGFYNPAGMTQFHGVLIDGGAQFVNINTKFTSPTGAATTNTTPIIGLLHWAKSSSLPTSKTWASPR